MRFVDEIAVLRRLLTLDSRARETCLRLDVPFELVPS
jgi:hypothetical protein